MPGFRSVTERFPVNAAPPPLPIGHAAMLPLQSEKLTFQLKVVGVTVEESGKLNGTPEQVLFEGAVTSSGVGKIVMVVGVDTVPNPQLEFQPLTEIWATEAFDENSIVAVVPEGFGGLNDTPGPVISQVYVVEFGSAGMV